MRVALVLFLTALAATADEPIPGIGPAGETTKLHGGFRFTEGPAVDAIGNVYFTDIPNERILKVDLAGKLSVFAEKTERTNGLMFRYTGALVGCAGGSGKVVEYAADGSGRKELAGTYEGKRFNAPNDLVIDRTGGIYFTDPHFGRRQQPLPQGTFAVYYVAPEGKVTRLVKDLPKGNGIILSPDEKTLYVVPSLSADVLAYPVTAPGKIGKGRVFFSLQQPEGRENTGGDGLTVDTKGNLYITSWLGIQVVSPAGKLLGVLEFAEKPANVTFGGKDRKTLYVTARTSLYTVPMHAQGHRFPAGGGK